MGVPAEIMDPFNGMRRGRELTAHPRGRHSVRWRARPVSLGCSILFSASCLNVAWAENPGWLGIYHEPVSPLPVVEEAAGGPDSLLGATVGLRVTAIFPDSPAERGGLLLRDLIVAVDGAPLDCPPESLRLVFQRSLRAKRAGDPFPLRVVRQAIDREFQLNGELVPAERERSFWRDTAEFLRGLESGSRIEAKASTHQRILELSVILGPRPEALWPAARSDDEIYPADRYPEGSLGTLTWQLAEDHGVRAETEDLLARLARCHATADPHRLECVMYVHRQPFRLENVAYDLSGRFLGSRNPARLLAEARALLVPESSPSLTPRTELVFPPLPDPIVSDDLRPPPTVRPKPGERKRMLEPLIDDITTVLLEASRQHALAFAALTDEDKRFLETARYDLSDVFAEEIYIHFDEDRDRFARNRRLLELAARVDYGALLACAERLALLSDPSWVRQAALLVRAAFADTLEAEVLYDEETPVGRILLGGTARHWYRDTDVAFALDLGGDDFYTGNAGAGHGWETPVSVCLDLEGNDAYESTRAGCQGTGCLGVGVLLDISGDDSYIGLQWAQGTGYFGIGWLRDLGGNDTYRGRTFCQGAGLFGLGLLLDEQGGDRYEGDAHVQGVGLARGIGALLDHAGDDEYYAKGLYPTGYGDAGIFDAWSQGCGTGFRTLTSGGVGLLLDAGGDDRMEAGNFSQGGGYYYAWGLLHARGSGRDTYIGSRYNQGFSAHQAVGTFLEDGGDDVYVTHQGVAQGLAWDECVTLFVDTEGNDLYQGGGSFSQGASAHNSIAFFVDRGGRDRYRYSPGPARAGGNDYHGGTSLSLFIDEGGGPDEYTSLDSENGAIRFQREYGFFLDLPGSLETALLSRLWRDLPAAGR